MTRAVRIRLLVFVVLSAVGVTYVASSYLGLVDRLLGRGLTAYVTLPTSGGLYEGSEVTYRGVGIGRVDQVVTTEDGIRVRMRLEEGTELPRDAPVSVNNLSAVGEQYLDFTPAADAGPFVGDGEEMVNRSRSVPVDEGDLLMSLDDFVDSVDKRSLRVLVRELGTGFAGTGAPLQQVIDEGGRFVDAANAASDDTIRLIRRSQRVLATQQDESENIVSFSQDLAELTDALADSDPDLRRVLRRTPPAAVQLRRLVEGLEPTLPVLLNDLILVNQVLVDNLDGLEETLYLFPRVIAGGPTGTDSDGYAFVNFQFTRDGPACTEGYLPVQRWKDPRSTRDGKTVPRTCTDPDKVQRGPRYAPDGSSGTSGTNRPAPAYDASSRLPDGYSLGLSPDLGPLGEDAWTWLILDPAAP